jgi:hypothetical protein
VSHTTKPMVFPIIFDLVRRRAKKSRLRQGGSLSIQEAQELRDEIEVKEQIKEEMQARGRRMPRTETRARRCGNCGDKGHNTHTCQVVVETSEEDDSAQF